MHIKKVLLLGGSGFVGTYIANRLSQRGMEVTVPTRRRERTKALIIQPNVEMPEVKIDSEETLVSLMQGQDVVINLVGVLHSRDVQLPYSKDFAEAHVELPKKIVAACKKAGVRRLVHMSADAFVDSLSNPATFGQAYDLVGPKVYTLRELVDYTASLVGSTARVIALPEGLAYLQAGLMWLAPNPLMSPDNLRSMEVDSVCDSNCTLPTGWKPTALEAIAPTYIARNTPKGKLDRFRFRAGR